MKAWEDFLSQQEQELGADAVNKWLKPLKIVRFDACNLYLEAKDSFQALWFEEHIRPKIQSKFINNNNKKIKVHLNITNAPASPSKNKSLPSNRNSAPEQKANEPFTLSFDLLDPFCTFHHFVVFGRNTLVYKLLCKVCGIDETTWETTTTPELSVFNPIYIHGGSGTGKTHLLMAAAHVLSKRGLKVLYVRAETFTQHVVSAIRAGEMNVFRQAYRNSDVLLIDDVHYFARKGTTQEELFHTFNTLQLAGKQIILTANCSPSELEMIEPRLISRFEWGIVLPLEVLEKEQLKILLEKKAEALNFPLHAKVTEFLITTFSKGPKSLIKALQALVLRVHLMESRDGIAARHITVPLTQQLLLDLIQEEEKKSLTSEKILQMTADYFGVPLDTIMSKDKAREAVLPRQFAMFFCRTLLNLPFMKIGGIFMKDHSTVMSSVKIVQKALDDNDPEMKGHQLSLLKKFNS